MRPGAVAAAAIIVLAIVIAAWAAWRVKNSPAHADRYQTTPEERALHTELYALLGRVGAALRRRGIPFWATGGTVLGAVRHGGMIPWDDDVDIAVWAKDVSRTRRAILEDLGDVRWVTQTRCHTVVKGRANLDIFSANAAPGARGLERVRFSNMLARQKWPREYFRPEEVANRAERPFGPVMVPVAANPCAFLDRAYPGWDRTGYVARHLSLGHSLPEGAAVRFRPSASRRGCAPARRLGHR